MLSAPRTTRYEGRLLAAEPVLVAATLPLVAFAIAAAMPVRATGIAWILLFAVWPTFAVERLRRRAHAYCRWYRTAVARHGGSRVLLLPARAPDLETINRPDASWQLSNLEQSELRFLRAPGRTSRRWNAGSVLAWGGAAAVAFCGGGRWAIGVGLALVSAGGTALLWSGGRRPWPAAWPVVERPSRVLGPIWLALAAGFIAAIEFAAHASNATHGVRRGVYLVGLLAFLWTQRAVLDRLAGVEGRRGYRIAEAFVERAAPLAWWVVVTFRGLMLALAVVTFWLAPIAPDALPVASIAFGLGVILSPVVAEWRRPSAARVVSVQEGAEALAIPLIERRVTAVLVVLTGVGLLWSFLSA